MRRALTSPTWWVGILLMVPFAAALIDSTPWSLGGKLAPWIVGCFSLSMLAIHTVRGALRGIETDIAPLPDGSALFGPATRRIFAWVALLLLLVPLLGYEIALPLYIVVYMTASGVRLLHVAICAAIMFAFVHFVLEGAIHVGLPSGYIPDLLGV